MGNCCCLNNTGTLTEDTLCGDFSFSLASGGVGTATIFQAPGKTVCGSVNIFLDPSSTATTTVAASLNSTYSSAVINTNVSNTSSATFQDLTSIVLNATASNTGTVSGKYCVVSHYNC